MTLVIAWAEKDGTPIKLNAICYSKQNDRSSVVVKRAMVKRMAKSITASFFLSSHCLQIQYRESYASSRQRVRSPRTAYQRDVLLDYDQQGRSTRKALIDSAGAKVISRSLTASEKILQHGGGCLLWDQFFFSDPTFFYPICSEQHDVAES